MEMNREEKRRDDYREEIDGERGVMSIIREVAAKHNIPMPRMLGGQKDKFLAQARQEAYYRCRNETTASLPQIGREFGNRDHTTILKGLRKHEQRLAKQGGPQPA